MPATQPPMIRQLDDRIANQIAAGEVVERPAAVVKELVENALDAESTRIEVRLEDGGRQLIEVVDNGHGMRRDDLLLAVSRHATSKLRSSEDLFRISSLGFRGEALPSIASVCEFRLASCPSEGDGCEMTINGGRMQHGPQPCAVAPGTRVSARNLFYNVPARLKFMKSARAEGAAVTDTLTRLAIGHPQVGVRLHLDGRQTLDLAPEQRVQERLAACLGRDVAESLLAVEGMSDATQIHGFAAHPRHAKPSAKKQFVYLNGRPINDRLLVAAIREGYAGFLEPRLHGVVVLYIDTDPSLVDVNVHPTKAEIRFRRQGEVFALVRDAINKALRAESGGFQLTGNSSPGGTADASSSVRRHLVRPLPTAPSTPPPAPTWQERFLPQEPHTPSPSPTIQPSAAETSAQPPPRRLGEGDISEALPPSPTPSPEVTNQQLDLPGIRQVFQVNDMYVVVETDDGIRMIDQHALHEKALYLCLDPRVRDFERGGRQELLIPTTVELDASEIATVEEHLPALAEVGIEAEIFGPTQLIVRAFPAALGKISWQHFFNELAAQGPGRNAVERLRERLAHRKACTSAIKAGQRLSRAEMLELVHLLYSLERMEHCPHGRPTTLDLSWGELERRFQR
ncbi:MAG: DNA mismatch repair endonuclease MutL [Planctomycetota bacterium]|nr:MAG: DNA mismatch repair endonuclease MutL [Planctomycetota bacterium]